MSQITQASANPAAPLPWRRGAAWLLLLGPLFFLSYGYTNQLAAQRAITESIYFEWEKQISFLPWTIVPYWSIDLLYGFSFLCCLGARAVDRLGLRLLTAQLISVVCFVVLPLRFAFERPPSDGIFGALFDALTSFDQPYNQAPSLHISLLVIIWAQFAGLRTSPSVRLFIHFWALLIGVSVLTTWQHHFIDIPTGAAVGLLCLWLWPADDRPTPLMRGSDAGHFRLAGFYLAGALLALLTALTLNGVWLWLAWLAMALGLVAFNYAWAGSNGFQKTAGRHSLAVTWLFAPYVVGAWINSRLWTRRRPQADLIADEIWLGRQPNDREFAAGRFSALFDLTAELPAPNGTPRYDSSPCLDMSIPPAGTLVDAAHRIEAMRGRGPVLVACALGYSRSAAAVAAWLLVSGRAASVEEAIALLRQRRPQIVLGSAWQNVLTEVEQLIKGAGHEH